MEINRKALFNERGDVELTKRKMINGNTTNLNDFNNIKYTWVSDMYRTMMNNFWIPEEINMNQDIKDYRNLDFHEKKAYDKILSFLIFLDSIQTANLPNISDYTTANEVNLILTIQAYQEAIHSQSYSYILDTIASPEERTEILYQWRDDEHLLNRNKFIGNIYNDFVENHTKETYMKTVMGNYILEGIYFYSGFMFFYNLGRMGKMPGTVQEIRYINRDENTHLWLFRNIIQELKKEEVELFTEERINEYKCMLMEGVRQEIEWGQYVIGDNIQGITAQMVKDYIEYLGNLRSRSIGFGNLFDRNIEEPNSMKWVSEYSNPNEIKTDFFEGKVSAYSKSSVFEDDL
ncbi:MULTISPECIES: ribonucleotide-diphosphate reductase subunit beta [Peptoniphilus]|uniref:ribonucleotide-diphosphate reductase subunit beta n=1 Tax=Peptoniphilus TaxID=162289 RepID=UPI0001DA9B4D|nr:MULTISPECIES: ribonucleotide-diphosphate reductase subunit beta [Peptoniphilus]EFI42326.1 ribonucleoside-diphosphate reductase, beta subunit [Peptoniphilus sp. oral taxon 386 str. F0131]